MNTYATRFFACCPNNGIRIGYHLTINTTEVVSVEHITATVESIDEGFHEDIADQLHKTLGGEQVLIADHHGVTITTLRRHEAVSVKQRRRGPKKG